MYYATGLPGWMRFGYSPGLGGMPPGAQYIMQTGQMPQFAAFMQQQAPAGVTPVQPMTQIPKEQELQMLENQANILEHQLKEIKKRMGELKK